MQTRLLWRRSVTALGLYGGFGLGLLASVLAARQLGPTLFGQLTLAIFAAGFLQLVFDLTVEEVMIKYGFRYTTEERWGRLRRLYRQAMLFKTIGAGFAAGGGAAHGAVGGARLQTHPLHGTVLVSGRHASTCAPPPPPGR